eukprot:COSAG02_NODE_52162_length_309_cov_1.161905_1_plen_25_part_10
MHQVHSRKRLRVRCGFRRSLPLALA